MNQFFVFYDAGTDSEEQAQSYADEATVRAKSTGKVLLSQIIDISADSPERHFWCGTTIECAAIKDGQKIGSCLNPSALADIDALIDQLYAS